MPPPVFEYMISTFLASAGLPAFQKDRLVMLIVWVNRGMSLQGHKDV